MKIEFGYADNKELSQLDIGSQSAVLSGVYCGIGIETDQGLFGIAQRDMGIEILLDGKLVWSSMELIYDAEKPPKGEKGD